MTQTVPTFEITVGPWRVASMSSPTPALKATPGCPTCTFAADVNPAETCPTRTKKRTPTTSTPRRKHGIPDPVIPKPLFLRAREHREVMCMPPPEMDGALSLGGASTEMDPWLCAEARCPSSSGVRAGHRHACGVGITRGVQGCMVL